jgi:hypothetical protein
MVSLSIDTVWKLIMPAIPDTLEYVGNGEYLAKWWKPVPVRDVEWLQRSEAVNLHGNPFEPKHLPGGLAVCFSINSEHVGRLSAD